MTSSALYVGHVAHRRTRPVDHAFRYRVCSMLVDLDELPALDAGLRLFSHNRRNVVSFLDRDHGPKDGSPLRPWIDRLLAGAGIQGGGPVRILCSPRLYGYVFNPLSEWFCHDRDGRLTAILHEVRNTFGEWHAYLVPVDAGRIPGEPIVHQCAKVFHVSPFMDMDLEYRFRIVEPADRAVIAMRLFDGNGELFTASFAGERRELTATSLRRALVEHPLMTAKVIGGIHREALTLLRKGAPFRRKPEAPPNPVTIVRPESAAAGTPAPVARVAVAS